VSALHVGDIIKLEAEGTEKLGLISEVGDDTMVRIATNWYDLEEFEVTILHSEVDTPRLDVV
jgi:hypothetical protein